MEAGGSCGFAADFVPSPKLFSNGSPLIRDPLCGADRGETVHLLNIRALKQDLVAGRVTNYEVAIYLFLTGHVGVPIWYLEAMPEQFSFRELFIMGSIVATGLLIAYFGYRACYYANGGLPGKSFAERFVSVGFVVGLRLSLVLILPYFLVIWLLEIRSEQALRAPFLAFELIYFWRVRFHLTEMRESAPRAA